MYFIREALTEDASAIAPHLRDADKNEITASSGPNHTTAILYSILSSNAWTVCLPDGTPICIYGVGDDTRQGMGIPWMIGTNEMVKHRKALIRDARNWIRRQFEFHKYAILYNYVDGRNTAHIKWLHHMGFTVSDIPEYIGADPEVPFHSFHRSRSCA
jgi:hypothetical protein